MFAITFKDQHDNHVADNRSPRWSGGYSRMLPELALKFEFHAGRTFERKEKRKGVNSRLRAPSSAGRRKSMRADEGRKGWSLLAIKMNVP